MKTKKFKNLTEIEKQLESIEEMTIRKQGVLGQRISDLITDEEIAKWGKKDLITINAGTGVGKTYFIKNKLYEFAIKNGTPNILVLQHRVANKNQTQIDVEGKLITVMTYQYLNSNINKINLDDYYYIVCDECQFFTDDATFNRTTDTALHTILGTSAIKIFMTATGTNALPTIKEVMYNNFDYNNIYEYIIPHSYNYVKNVTYYKSYKKTEPEHYLQRECSIINDVLQKGEKIIIFMNDKEKCIELFKKYKDKAMFNCSMSNNFYTTGSSGKGTKTKSEIILKKDYSKFVNSEHLNYLLENCKLPDGISILITTTCMDAGVNILDTSVKTIIFNNVFETSAFIQCLGRRRMVNSEDYIRDIYIRPISNSGIRIREYKMKYIFDIANEFLEYNTKDKIDEYIINHSNNNTNFAPLIKIVTKAESETRFALNVMLWSKHYFAQDELIKMKEYKSQWNYCVYMNNLLQRENPYEYSIMDLQKYGETREYDTIEIKGNKVVLSEDIINELDTFATQKTTFNTEQRQIIINLLQVRDDGKPVKGLKRINRYLEQNEVPYRLTNRIRNKHSYWSVVKVNPNTGEPIVESE